MSDSSAFLMLDERIQRFLWQEGWSELRDAQEEAIPLVLSADRDVIVSAATASGKTEAAFLPALTYLAQTTPPGLIVYISPLKALINDQFGRLDRLCEDLETSVWPWHGDISSSRKTKFFKDPQGVLLITPESLEAMFCNRGTTVARIFEHTAFIVIDELHAFIGSERGKQLQSLMHRIESVIGRSVPRIGLSATLGDMQLAANFLRPNLAGKVSIVQSRSSGNELKILIKGFEEPILDAPEPQEDEDQPEAFAPAHIAHHLFKTLRGTNNLVFPNSRREVERYTHLLNQLCEVSKVPVEFWPHHGSLSKEIRSETEAALKQKEMPATAICTNSLELGIDIGAVKSVAQIGPPPSVASLRQRLGRSGRRKGEPAILRGYCIENALVAKSSLGEKFRLGTVQTAAMVSLLLEKWCEPPPTTGAHLSTLIQQLLSSIAQNGGVTATEAYDLLCSVNAPFSTVSKSDFASLLRFMHEKDLLVQDSSGLLLHGHLGEQFVNHYDFYAAFQSDEEFRIVSGSRTLGTLPVSQMLIPGQRILFAGRTWRVEQIDELQKTIYVSSAKGGTPPLFNGGVGRMHTKVRQRMRELLDSNIELPYLDETAQRFLREGQQNFQRLGFTNKLFIDEGPELTLLTWLGDSANEAIACFLLQQKITAAPTRLGVEVTKGNKTTEDIIEILRQVPAHPIPNIDGLLSNVSNLQREKWDWALPELLLQKTYASACLDVNEGYNWCAALK